MIEAGSAERERAMRCDFGLQGHVRGRMASGVSRRSPDLLRLYGLLLLGAFFLTFPAGGLWADSPRMEGEGILGARDLSEQSLEVGGAVYFFNASSVIVGRSGEVLALADLEVHDAGGKPGLRPILSGRFSATEVGSRFVIQRLELIESAR